MPDCVDGTSPSQSVDHPSVRLAGTAFDRRFVGVPPKETEHVAGPGTGLMGSGLGLGMTMTMTTEVGSRSRPLVEYNQC